MKDIGKICLIVTETRVSFHYNVRLPQIIAIVCAVIACHVTMSLIAVFLITTTPPRLVMPSRKSHDMFSIPTIPCPVSGRHGIVVFITEDVSGLFFHDIRLNGKWYYC